MVKKMPRLKYNRGLKIDPTAWFVLRDTYSLLDPNQRFDSAMRIPVSPDPFLIVREVFTHRQIFAKAIQSTEGDKIFYYGWSEDGVLICGGYPETFQELLFGLDGSFRTREQYWKRHKKNR
jgi:hypothetical protein